MVTLPQANFVPVPAGWFTFEKESDSFQLPVAIRATHIRTDVQFLMYNEMEMCRKNDRKKCELFNTVKEAKERIVQLNEVYGDKWTFEVVSFYGI